MRTLSSGHSLYPPRSQSAARIMPQRYHHTVIVLRLGALTTRRFRNPLF
jgi:hypothetical protein